MPQRPVNLQIIAYPPRITGIPPIPMDLAYRYARNPEERGVSHNDSGRSNNQQHASTWRNYAQEATRSTHGLDTQQSHPPAPWPTLGQETSYDGGDPSNQQGARWMPAHEVTLGSYDRDYQPGMAPYEMTHSSHPQYDHPGYTASEWPASTAEVIYDGYPEQSHALDMWQIDESAAGYGDYDPRQSFDPAAWPNAMREATQDEPPLEDQGWKKDQAPKKGANASQTVSTDDLLAMFKQAKACSPNRKRHRESTHRPVI